MRIDSKCCGDCGKCQLLIDGQVDMIPCVLDQIFQRVKRLEEQSNNKGKKRVSIADLPDKNE